MRIVLPLSRTKVFLKLSRSPITDTRSMAATGEMASKFLPFFKSPITGVARAAESSFFTKDRMPPRSSAVISIKGILAGLFLEKPGSDSSMPYSATLLKKA
jgi:hypothetical protein